MTHICVSKIIIIGSDNGLSPGRRLIEIQTFSFNKMHLKMSAVKWRPFCLGLNVLKEFRHNQPRAMCSTNDKLPHQIINGRIHYMGESMIGTDQAQAAYG